MSFIIVKNWDKTIESLQQQVEFEALALKIGFDLTALVAVLNREFPKNIRHKEVNNSAGEKIDH